MSSRPHDPALPSGLDLEERAPAEARPFLRCARCQTDNHRRAPSCAECGTSLDTAEQRAFDERFWEQRRAAAAVEQAEVEKLRATLVSGVRDQGETLAAGVRMNELRRLSDLDDSTGTREGKGRRSSGLELLRSIPDARVRTGVTIALIVTACFGVLCFFAGRNPELWGILLVLAGIAFYPRLPPARRRRSFFDRPRR